jgi:hypothetical protein
MEPNPRVPSRLGCGGLLLLFQGLPWVGLLVIGVIGQVDMSEAELKMGDEHYAVGPALWAIAPLAVISVFAVYRVMLGYRDWLATAAAAGWVVVGVWYAITTSQYTWLAWSVLMLFLLATGTARDRRELAREETEPT